MLQRIANIEKVLDLRIESAQELPDGLWAFPFSEDDRDLYKLPILIASDNYEEIASRLKGMGLFENLNFWSLGQFLLDYSYLLEGRIYLDNCQISCTECCTLRCRDCIAFAPYQKDKSLVPLETMERDIDAYFRFCDQLNVFRIIGGEPFLHPLLADAFEYIEARYGERIQEYEITTNGTVLPEASVLGRLKKLGKLHIHISDYTDMVPAIKGKVDEAERTFRAEGIPYARRPNLMWQDFRIQDETFKLDRDVPGHMRRCEESCQHIGDGKYYLCGTAYYVAQARFWQSKPEDCFDLTCQASSERKAAFYLYNSRVLPEQAISLCAKCAGMDPYHEFPIRAAIQI